MKPARSGAAILVPCDLRQPKHVGQSANTAHSRQHRKGAMAVRQRGLPDATKLVCNGGAPAEV